MPLGCSHAQSRVKLILSASTSKINISGHPTGASGIEFHYKGPDITYLVNTEEERKLTWYFSFFETENSSFAETIAVRHSQDCAYKDK